MHIAGSGNHSFQWKPFLLVKAIPFSGSRFFQWKALLLIQIMFLLAEIIPLSGIHSFQWKPFLQVRAIPFSESHSFQCFSIFVSRSISSYVIIKYIVLDCDSVRILKMANLSCIHIPIDLFQSSETYLEPCETSRMKHF